MSVISQIQNHLPRNIAIAAALGAGLAELIMRVVLPCFGIHAPEGFSSLTDGLIIIGAPAGAALVAGLVTGLAINRMKATNVAPKALAELQALHAATRNPSPIPTGQPLTAAPGTIHMPPSYLFKPEEDFTLFQTMINEMTIEEREEYLRTTQQHKTTEKKDQCALDLFAAWKEKKSIRVVLTPDSVLH